LSVSRFNIYYCCLIFVFKAECRLYGYHFYAGTCF